MSYGMNDDQALYDRQKLLDQQQAEAAERLANPPDHLATLTELDEAIDAERALLRELTEPLKANILRMMNERKRVAGRVVETLDPATPSDLALLLRLGWSDGLGHVGAHKKLEAFYRSFGKEIWTGGWNTQDPQQPYLEAQVALTRGQDVEQTAKALMDLSARLALGRETVTIQVLESSLSELGSYLIRYTVEGGLATLVRVSYGVERELSSGTLLDVLKMVARDYWLEDRWSVEKE